MRLRIMWIGIVACSLAWPAFAQELAEKAVVDNEIVNDEGYGADDTEYYGGESNEEMQVNGDEFMTEQDLLEQLEVTNDMAIPDDEMSLPDYSSSALPDEQGNMEAGAPAGNAQTP